MRTTWVMCILVVLAVTAGCGDEAGAGPDAAPCLAGSTVCDGTCVNTDNDNAHCGTCGNECSAGRACNGTGVCELSCQSGLVDCDGTCIDPNTDQTYCGAGGDCTAAPGDVCIAEESCIVGACEVTLDLVSIPGGSFQMGSVRSALELPIHTVNVPAFAIMRAEVTASAYRACVDDGGCSAPTISDSHCNYGTAREATGPRNCVAHDLAAAYCAWAGGRLPSEAEWEFAARRNTGRTYPWGDTAPTCLRAVMDETGVDGCGTTFTHPACSIPAGNTSDGLCDMAGNVWEWVEDDFHFSYDGAPTDGSAWVDSPRSLSQTYRGGSFASNIAALTATVRNGNDPFAAALISVGFRCVR